MCFWVGSWVVYSRLVCDIYTDMYVDIYTDMILDMGQIIWFVSSKKKKMRHGILFTSQCHDFDQEYPLQKFISIRCLQIHTCFFHNNHVSVIDLFLHIKCWRNSWVYLTSNQRNAQNIRTTESVSGPKEWQHKYTQKWKKYMYPTLLLIDSSFTF